ncbi:unnamed protein product [Cuscuta campestris]|uniref:Protein kinase domain-containing protein n=1 Tax=Cuscuta campestris TaxID=132261 RepID=A0A484KSA7_9ASTE|nr:unnamed protein product [Cuscuta campestris]
MEGPFSFFFPRHEEPAAVDTRALNPWTWRRGIASGIASPRITSGSGKVARGEFDRDIYILPTGRKAGKKSPALVRGYDHKSKGFRGPRPDVEHVIEKTKGERDMKKTADINKTAQHTVTIKGQLPGHDPLCLEEEEFEGVNGEFTQVFNGMVVDSNRRTGVERNNILPGCPVGQLVTIMHKVAQLVDLSFLHVGRLLQEQPVIQQGKALVHRQATVITCAAREEGAQVEAPTGFFCGEVAGRSEKDWELESWESEDSLLGNNPWIPPGRFIPTGSVMEREANRPTPPAATAISIPVRPINPNPHTTKLHCSSNSSPSAPDFLREVQATFKRHRPLVNVQSNNLRPRREQVPRREVSRSSITSVGSTCDMQKGHVDILVSHNLQGCISQTQNTVSVVRESQEDASVTPRSDWNSTLSTNEQDFRPLNARGDQVGSTEGHQSNITFESAVVSNPDVPLAEGKKKVHYATDYNPRSQGIGWFISNQLEAPTAAIQIKEQRVVSLINLVTFYRMILVTQLLNLRMSSSQLAVDRVAKSKLSCEEVPHKDITQPLHLSSKNENKVLAGQEPLTASDSRAKTEPEAKMLYQSKEQHSIVPKLGDTSIDPSPFDGSSGKVDALDIQSENALPKVSSSGLKEEPSKLEKLEKGTNSKVTSSSRRKTHDSDLYFNVNGKIYQRLGKIGSGGSSEVHKVISSDCRIYALKRIKLKGRDYATAYGFCQEIEYLKRFKGNNNIIQLVDFEVTDKNLLQEVMSGSMSNKECKVKEDGFIYMVLEYGEIDLAHMLSQKWKELDDCNATIDENWLRFYWQQILLAVKTIHEERIVHSDLKPANFLLVKGSLKLIDFGIAKAILNDTTNIQRDGQVGTLSYMSPEAFLCNETDANGNIIKCGRPSDIWSLGCILYQMVYGRTPFSEHRTFWAKFKVITDANHEITYEPVSNPWLLDLMKNCLTWDRNKRWRIPQLLQHPFLVPPIPTQPPSPSSPQDQSCKLLQLLLNACQHDQNALMLCSQLQQLLADPQPSQQLELPVSSSTSRECELLNELSKLCIRLRGHLAMLGGT